MSRLHGATTDTMHNKHGTGRRDGDIPTYRNLCTLHWYFCASELHKHIADNHNKE